MGSANGICVAIGNADYMGFKMNGGVEFEVVQDIITPFPASDKGHVDDLLAHKG
jgi:hypothetical protein